MFALTRKKEKTASLSLARCFGAIMLAHFAYIIMWKLQADRLADLASICNVALFIAAIGLIKRSAWLVSSALVSVAVFHTVWLIDFGGILMLGTSPMGLAVDLIDAGNGTWLSYAHYFYLLPILTAAVVLRKWAHRAAFLTATGLFAYLVVVSRIFATAEENTNSAYAVDLNTKHELIDMVNALPMAQYLAVLIVFIALFAFAPIAVVVGSFRKAEKKPA